MAKAEYMICDKCEKKITKKEFYKLSIVEIPLKRVTTGEIQFDICNACYEKIFEFLKRR